jgi:hypothetical protein
VLIELEPIQKVKHKMVRRTHFLSLAFAHNLHEWLIPPANSSSRKSCYDAFRTVCEKAGITRVGFLRHGKTAPKPVGGHDFDRLLTDEGRKQAEEAGLSFGRDLKPFYSALIVSPAPRTMETADLFLATAQARDCTLKPVKSIYDGTMQPKGSALFQKIGYAPLRDYLDSKDAEDRDLSRNLLGMYADTVVKVMSETVAESSSGTIPREAGTTLWMVGHAIYLPAAALGVASIVGSSDSGIETILSSNTREAEGYLIDLEDADVTYLARPSNPKQ